LSRIRGSYNLSIKTKIKVYESLAIPVFFYGSECWNLRKREESNIMSTEMGWLRKMLGVSRLQKMRNETVRNILKQKETIIEKSRKEDLHGSVMWKGWKIMDSHTRHSTATSKSGEETCRH